MGVKRHKLSTKDKALRYAESGSGASKYGPRDNIGEVSRGSLFLTLRDAYLAGYRAAERAKAVQS